MVQNSEDFLAVLNTRSQDIFRKIVERYLDTGMPVGSRDLSRMLEVGLSPASVRNVMSDLEDLGLIAAPHTSAGRAPTQQGLRFFVDAMLEVGAVDEREKKQISKHIEGQAAAGPVEDLLAEASHVLSGLSQGGGILAGLAMSWLIDNWRPGSTLFAVYSIATASLLLLALGIVGGTTGWTMLLIVAMGGVSGGGMAFPALTAYLFPSRLLSSAIGMGVLIARGGAIAAPLIGGALLTAGAGPATFLFAAVLPCAGCAAVSLALPKALRVRELENPSRDGETAAAAGR